MANGRARNFAGMSHCTVVAFTRRRCSRLSMCAAQPKMCDFSMICKSHEKKHVTVAIETNLLVLIRAEAYLPPDDVLVTTELMVQFGKRYLYSPRLTTNEASVARSSYSC